jgi:hypothetical protein
MKPASHLLHLSAALALVLMVAPTAAEGPKPAVDASLVRKQFDIARDGDALLLPVTLKGKKYLFVVDTGANTNFYDRSLPLGRPRGEAMVAGADGPVSLPLYDSPDTSVGGLSLRSDRPVCGVDMRPFREASGYEVYGVIGMGFLRDHVIRIDFDGGKLTFLKEAGKDPGLAVPITFSPRGGPLGVGGRFMVGPAKVHCGHWLLGMWVLATAGFSDAGVWEPAQAGRTRAPPDVKRRRPGPPCEGQLYHSGKAPGAGPGVRGREL